MATETTEPPAPPTHSNRFFSWMRTTGVVRQPGWIGGVCAGIAERIGVDPIIVRGIAVVIAVLGGPAILLYAAAWLLLPDRFDQIHLERLFRGTVDAPIAAIAGLVVLSMLPVTQGFWSVGAAFWEGGATVGRILWTVLLLAALVGVIVWVARRQAPRAPTFDTADAATAPSAETAAAGGPETVPASDAAVATPTTVPLAKPERPGADATTEDFAAWREQQAAWKAERAAFGAQEAATLREVNLARAQERREAAAARNAAYAERRAAWLRANPRLSGGLAATAIGAAIIAGAVAGLIASTVDSWRGAEVAAGLATATLVLGVVIVLAAAFGRRNGFIVFLSVVLLVATLFAAVVPNDRTLVGVRFDTSSSGMFTQFTGRTQIDAAARTGGVVDLWQGTGSTYLTIPAGRTVRVELTSHTRYLDVYRAAAPGYVQQPEDVGIDSRPDGSAYAVIERAQFTRADDGYHYAETFGPGAVPDTTVRIWQGNGDVRINDENQKAVTQ